jgi:hypothetical protein
VSGRFSDGAFCTCIVTRYIISDNFHVGKP